MTCTVYRRPVLSFCSCANDNTLPRTKCCIFGCSYDILDAYRSTETWPQIMHFTV